MSSGHDGWNPSPRSDWRVSDPRRLIDEWLAQQPPQEVVEIVILWLAAVEVDGPPPTGARLYPDDDVFIALVPGTNVTMTYRVVDYEFRVTLRSID